MSIFSRDAGMMTQSCLAINALRIRVSISAIGSVVTPTPVTSPARLHQPGDFAPVGQGAQADPAQPELPEHRARPAAVAAAVVAPHLELRRCPPFDEQGFLWHLRGPPDRRGLPHRKTHQAQQLRGLLVGPRRRHDGNVHPADLVDLVVLDLREDELLPDADVHAPAAVQRPARQPLEVLDARQADVEQLVQKLVHALTAQRHLAADRVPRAQLERRDGPPGAGDHRSLPADEGELLHRLVQVPLVRERIRDPHVHDDLFHPRHLHRIRVPEALPQGAGDLRPIPLTQPCHAAPRSVYALSISSLQWRHTRTVVPSSIRWRPNRTARPQRVHTSIALAAGNGISFCAMPPDGIFSFGLVWRFATATPSTMIRASLGSTRRTLPRLPRYLPWMTSTVSPRRTWIAARTPPITAPPGPGK